MEIRVSERMMGHELRDRILERHGSREALEAKAKKRSNVDARVDLVDLNLLEEDPRRLTMEMRLEEITKLTPKELERLTGKRLRLLHYLGKRREGVNLSRLSSGLRRDKKNISEDVRILEELGFVSVERDGRAIHIRLRGNQLHLDLTA